jgi:prepilin-type N-terminal cleavage/methylation domain-containing protein
MQRVRVRGFTLIELLLVIAIIGILAGIVLASFNSARQGAQLARTQKELQQLRDAMYYAKINSGQTLYQLTGNTWSGSMCTGDLRESSGACYTQWASVLSTVETAAGGVYGGLVRFDRDPWGSPYLLNENEGEPGFEWFT